MRLGSVKCAVAHWDGALLPDAHALLKSCRKGWSEKGAINGEKHSWALLLMFPLKRGCKFATIGVSRKRQWLEGTCNRHGDGKSSICLFVCAVRIPMCWTGLIRYLGLLSWCSDQHLTPGAGLYPSLYLSAHQFPRWFQYIRKPLL